MDVKYHNFSYYSKRLREAGVDMDEVYSLVTDLECSESRFRYTRDLLFKHNMLAPTSDYSIKYNDPSMSESLRQNGKEFFNAELYERAVDVYTKCLDGCVPSTECYALTLADRSAAYFHMSKFENCLKDLRCAMWANYPSKLMYKLYERAGHTERNMSLFEQAKESYAMCLTRLDDADMSAENKRKFSAMVKIAATEVEKQLTRQKNMIKIPVVEQLVGGRNKNIPALSAFVELKMSSDGLRGVYATHDINPGDVVAIDEPYICGPTTADSDVCNYSGCLKFGSAFFRCPKCLVVSYCNEDCRNKDNEEGHHMICPMMYFIRSTPGIFKMNELALKWFLKGYSKMGLENYCLTSYKCCNSVDDLKTRGFDEMGQYKSDSFLTAYSLDSSENKMQSDALFFFNCVAVDLLHYLMLNGLIISNSYLSMTGCSLVRILTILDLNFKQLNTIAPSVFVEQQAITVAFTLYPTISLFNHSCDANIKCSGVTTDRIRVMKAIQPIPKGSQLHCSYGMMFKDIDRKLRKRACKDKYYFKCSCEPCIKRWPHSHYIPNSLSRLNILNPSMFDVILSECKKFEEFRNLVRQENHRHYLSFLYTFIKLLYTNVIRPFILYEECLEIIGNAHTIKKSL